MELLNCLMKEVHNSSFSIVTVCRDSILLMLQWKPETVNLSNARYLKEMEIVLNHTLSSNITKIAVDIRELRFEINEGTQDSAASMFKGSNVDYVAIISSQDPHVEQAIDQTVEKYDELSGSKVKMAYFKEPNAAVNWLRACQ